MLDGLGWSAAVLIRQPGCLPRGTGLPRGRFSKRQRSSHSDVTVTAVSLLYLTWWWAMQHSSPEASAQSGYGAPEGCIRSCTALTMESRLNIRYQPRSTVRVTLRASVATSGHKTFCTKTLRCAGTGGQYSFNESGFLIQRLCKRKR